MALADPARAFRYRFLRNQVNRRRLERLQANKRSIDHYSVFQRDGWICQLCDAPVDPTLRFPDPASASLDHITPLAMGGRHELGNVQCSHLGCNMRKATRLSA